MHQMVRRTLCIGALSSVGDVPRIAGRGAGGPCIAGSCLAEECQLSRTTLLSILDDLEQDGFLTRRSVGNRYTLIMVTNWARYQSSDASGCKAGCSSAEQPALQPPDTIKEYKKARKELSSASDDAAVSEGAFPDAMGEGKPYLCPAIGRGKGGRAGTGRQGFGGSGRCLCPASPVAERRSRRTGFLRLGKRASAFRAGSCRFRGVLGCLRLPAREGGSGGYVACGYAQGS